VTGAEHWLPVLAGHGRVSFAKALAVIKELHYDGYVSFEWEKYWRPEIEEPEIALPDFINAIGRIFAAKTLQSYDTTECSGVGK
jgi:sugar phosphate isomerase/epimerase